VLPTTLLYFVMPLIVPPIAHPIYYILVSDSGFLSVLLVLVQGYLVPQLPLPFCPPIDYRCLQLSDQIDEPYDVLPSPPLAFAPLRGAEGFLLYVLSMILGLRAVLFLFRWLQEHESHQMHIWNQSIYLPSFFLPFARLASKPPVLLSVLRYLQAAFLTPVPWWW